MSCGVGCRHGSDPALLWLWRRLVATAPIQPLAWDPPCAVGAAQEKAKRKKILNITHSFITVSIRVNERDWGGIKSKKRNKDSKKKKKLGVPMCLSG